jgi:hypothetical protein
MGCPPKANPLVQRAHAGENECPRAEKELVDNITNTDVVHIGIV